MTLANSVVKIFDKLFSRLLFWAYVASVLSIAFILVIEISDLFGTEDVLQADLTAHIYQTIKTFILLFCTFYLPGLIVFTYSFRYIRKIYGHRRRRSMRFETVAILVLAETALVHWIEINL